MPCCCDVAFSFWRCRKMGEWNQLPACWESVGKLRTLKLSGCPKDERRAMGALAACSVAALPLKVSVEMGVGLQCLQWQYEGIKLEKWELRRSRRRTTTLR